MLNIILSIHSITFSSNNSSYGTVSKSEYLIVKGQKYSSSETTLTLQDGRKVTANVVNATGHTTKFSNWNPANSTGVNAKTAVTANFTRTVNSYTVTYNHQANGGTSSNTSAKVNYGGTVDLTQTATPKSGWTFVGWNTKQDATSA